MTNPSFSDFFYRAPDGLRLHARIYGEHRGALPAVCLAGLTRNARDFHELALYLSREAPTPRKVIAFDYRGRGRSDYDPRWENYDVLVETNDVIAGLAALGVKRAAFIGTSRSGLIIHVLAALRPDMIGAAVLNDVGPAVEPAGLAHIRSYLEKAPKPQSFAEAIAIQKSVQARNFPALTDADWERMVRAIHRDEDGVPVADFDPELIRTITGLDLDKPLPTLWTQFEMLAAVPLLAIRGEHSALLAAATLEEMAARHPDIETITVAGQGHAPLLETAGLPARIAAFLERADARPA